MVDVSLIKRPYQDPYSNYQIGRNTDPRVVRTGVAKTADADETNPLLDDSTQPVTPVEASPYGAFFVSASAMGIDMFTPNGGTAVSQSNPAVQLIDPALLNPDTAGQLLNLQTDTGTPAQTDVDGAMAALSQNYNLDAGPVALFKQINSNHSGTISPQQLLQAVTSGGGTVEQASALMKQLDPFGNGYVTVQNMMANLPGVTPPENTSTDTGSTTPASYDSTAVGGLTALASQYDVSQPGAVFQQLDTDFDGVLSQSDIVNAVTASGGSSDAANALYAQIDPANTGAVTQTQFVNNLLPRIEVPSFFI